ncbi:glycosyltransferase family 2 protein [Patescibacteria group bacterium]|nr:glycosyltransferase family 2 protein [Patescibacteria group bacterium]
MDIFIVIPAYNEEKVIRGVLIDLRNNFKNIIIIDDASDDKTVQIAEQFDILVLRHLINRGQGAALKTGIMYALNQKADVIVTFDADGQHHAEDVKNLVKPIIDGQVEVVLGSRFLNNDQSSNIPVYRKIILKLAVIFTKFSSKLNITDTHNGLRALSFKAASKIELKQDRMAHGSEILDEIYKNKLSYIEVPVNITYTNYSMTKGGANQNPSAFMKILFKYLLGRFIK